MNSLQKIIGDLLKQISFVLIKISFLVVLFASCEKIKEGECNTYIIHQGEHYSEGYSPTEKQFLQDCSPQIVFTITINESMFYNPEIVGFQNGHNKLRGFACGSELNVNQYSARTTFRCRSISEMDIGFIVHLPSLIADELILGFLLKDVQIGDLIYCVIEDKNSQGFYFSAENQNTGEFVDTLVDKRGAGGVKKHKLLEAPYFGGHESAPYEMYFEICTIGL